MRPGASLHRTARFYNLRVSDFCISDAHPQAPSVPLSAPLRMHISMHLPGTQR